MKKNENDEKDEGEKRKMRVRRMEREKYLGNFQVTLSTKRKLKVKGIPVREKERAKQQKSKDRKYFFQVHEK